MSQEIDMIKFWIFFSYSGNAIQFMQNNMFTQANGDRPGVPNIGIIVTDGRSNDPAKTQAMAQAARQAGIELFSVGVGSGVSRSELNTMATDPDTNHVFMVDDFSKLAQIKAAFQQQTCQCKKHSFSESYE